MELQDLYSLKSKDARNRKKELIEKLEGRFPLAFYGGEKLSMEGDKK